MTSPTQTAVCSALYVLYYQRFPSLSLSLAASPSIIHGIHTIATAASFVLLALSIEVHPSSGILVSVDILMH